ncbi:MAG: PaaX family transcriptional regulator C-terminal domain-containing protein, partial [Pseudomonadota bacterium]
MNTDPYRSSLDALVALGPMRVWSVLVTVFGDLAPNKPIAGPALTALMSEIGIKPEATRVALHRLRGDGWIVSEKVGRHSRHALSVTARADSEAARPQIYGAPPTPDDISFVLLRAGAPIPDQTHLTKIAPRLYSVAQKNSVPDGALVLNAVHLPDWTAAEIETPALREAYTSLLRVLRSVANQPLTFLEGPLQHAALRVLIVHSWRRLALRHALLPRAAHSPDWPGHDAREIVRDLLPRLGRPDP